MTMSDFQRIVSNIDLINELHYVEDELEEQWDLFIYKGDKKGGTQ